jgi:dihydrofolate reductase
MKVSLLAAMSVDGKIAESTNQNSTDWTSKEDIRFFVRKSKEIGALIMGLTTYETIGRPLPGRTIYVLCENPEEQVEQEGIVYTGGALSEILKQIQRDGHEQVLIAGGASVYSQFLQAGLVDELFLTVEPYLFGNGIGFVKDIKRMKMEFVAVEQIGEQTIVLQYRIPKE